MQQKIDILAILFSHSVMKHERHLRTRGKCRKHEPQASAFYISGVFSNARSVLSRFRKRS